MVLPEGIESDRQVDTLRLAVKNLKDLGDKLKDKLQAPRAKSFVQDIVSSLDPETNPAGYRICQDELARLGGASALIETVEKVSSDLVRSLALEALARMMFGNAGVAEAVLQSCQLLPMMRTVFSGGSTPEQLTALQLAQAMSASEALDSSNAYALLREAKVFLQENLGFAPISQAALEVFVSISFSYPAEVASFLGAACIKQLYDEQEDSLQAFVCGLLVSNCLGMLEGPEARDLQESLLSGTFLQNYVDCWQASLQKCDWPENSNAFHSPRRLALVAHALAAQGLVRHLLPAISLLVQAMEVNEDAVPILLVTLKILAADPRCLQILLGQESFRQQLDSMHQSGVSEASELLGYMELVENAMAVGQAAKLAQAAENPNAPEVMQLAEIFSAVRPLDGKLEATDLEQLCTEVPLVPKDKVLGSLRGDLTLQQFLEHVYGTPTILGWWPSLMEEAAAEAVASGLALTNLCSAFELAAKRGHVEIQDLHDVVLPTLGLPTEGDVVEEKFAELHGSAPLPFRSFAKWLADLYIKLSAETAEHP